MRKMPLALLATLLLTSWLTPHASAQVPPTVTLSASAAQVVFGESVTLSGSLSPPDASALVEIRDSAGVAVAAASPDATGAFTATITPDGTDTYVAFIPEALSQPVTVQVRATMTIRSSPVRLFGTVSVRGTVAPARPGRRVEVELTRGGRTIDRRLVAMGPSGAFETSFEVPLPGTYRARATFADDDLLPARATGVAGSTPLPRLSEGDDGVFVELLESRLADLHYRLIGTNDGEYDYRTADAVVAFHKVQRMPRSFVVSAATWRRLAQPRLPDARHGWRGFHFEVDQTLQVLYTVEGGDITNILHVSTGAGSATRDGSFRVYRKLAGYSPNRLYYPSYFDGLRALHGWTEVPTYNASHGCVRIPYWNAKWVYALADYGTRVVIYHS
ncbi:MAG TPA: L,D-transpeptidase family protein [Actinomycetota bacterium]|nr:L,D-transpeptidase family protein [Actinomycetota bacterium]